MPGDQSCGSGHAQPTPPTQLAQQPPTSFDLISALRIKNRGRPAPSGAAQELAPAQVPGIPLHQHPQLHISGFDPRAAGGRQAIKVELRGMPANVAPVITMQLRSALISEGGSRHSFARTMRGDWRPVFVEFSSRDKEHGQYQIDVLLNFEAEGQAPRRWVCTMVILVPRADASLTDIHQIFLSTHKNVRVMADDASIAKLNAQTGGGRLDIDVTARNASITHLNLDAGAGKVDMGFSTIAWDEDLIEIDVPAQAEPHPYPSSAACLVNAAPEAGSQRQVRLFALGECVLGRWERYDPEADVLLTHFGDDGQDRDGLTRRLSGRHAIIRRGGRGFEIEDVSRYGVLLDGIWPGKNKPVPLRLGMRIELTASIKGIVVLNVTALLPHGVILHRIDQGESAECFYFLEPGQHPGFPLPSFPREPRGAMMPVLFHQNGGFWHLDTVTGAETALCPSTALDRLSPIQHHTRFAGDPYPESWIIRRAGRQLGQALTALTHDMHTA
jgi:hypothetical protein